MSPIGVAEWISGAYEYRRAVTVTPGCIGYWPNVTPSPGTEQSVMAGGQPMSLVGNVSLGAALLPDENKCLQYSRTDTYGSVVVNATAQITNELWVNLDTPALLPGGAVGYLLNTSAGPGFYLQPYAGVTGGVQVVMRSLLTGGGILDIGELAPRMPGSLLHVVGTQDAAGKMNLYVNGESVFTYTLPSGTFLAGAATFYPAFRFDNNAFQGRLGHLSSYSRALTAAEIRWHYRVGADLEKLPSYATVETLKAAPSAPAGVTGSVTDESGTTTQLAPLIRDGVVSGSPSFKARLKETGLFVAA